ncbi:hypothetical protein BS17DRAFT_765553 [Gyrodon lividus]|nr:hypothetical protein BS17DRAFT_765553 [Gyrodon lividus]
MRCVLFSLSFASLFAAVVCGSSGPGGSLNYFILAKACPTQTAAEQSAATGAAANGSTTANPVDPVVWPPGCLHQGQLCGGVDGFRGQCCPGLDCVWQRNVTDTAYCQWSLASLPLPFLERGATDSTFRLSPPGRQPSEGHVGREYSLAVGGDLYITVVFTIGSYRWIV